jgi:hypothetical protein
VVVGARVLVSMRRSRVSCVLGLVV